MLVHKKAIDYKKPYACLDAFLSFCIIIEKKYITKGQENRDYEYPHFFCKLDCQVIKYQK